MNSDAVRSKMESLKRQVSRSHQLRKLYRNTAHVLEDECVVLLWSYAWFNF